MKTKNKLALNKKTVANLNNNAMGRIRGGWDTYTCCTECDTVYSCNQTRCDYCEGPVDPSEYTCQDTDGCNPSNLPQNCHSYSPSDCRC